MMVSFEPVGLVQGNLLVGFLDNREYTAGDLNYFQDVVLNGKVVA